MVKKCDKSQVSKRELRQFGSGLALLGGLLGGALLWQGRAIGIGVMLVGLLMAIGLWFELRGAQLFYASWMKVARRMARFTTGLGLSLLYLLLLTPLAVVARICGKCFLDVKFREPRDSYWVAHDKAGSADRDAWEKQF